MIGRRLKSREWVALCGALAVLGSLAPTASALKIRAAHSKGSLTIVSRKSGRHGKIIDFSEAGTISANGRYVVFKSGGRPLYIRDLKQARTRRIFGGGFQPALSANGRYLAYMHNFQVYKADLRRRTTQLISAGHPPRPSEEPEAGQPAISADGRFVAFHRFLGQVYLRDTRRGTTTIVSRASGRHGRVPKRESSQPTISPDGRFVAFTSWAAHLDPTVRAPRSYQYLYVRDLRTHRTSLVSVPVHHGKPNLDGFAGSPSLSAEGHYLAFALGGYVWLRNLRSGRTFRLSRYSSVEPEAAVSADGRFVAYNEDEWLFLWDRRTHASRFIGLMGEDGGGLSLSASGRRLLFDTYTVGESDTPGRNPDIPKPTSGPPAYEDGATMSRPPNYAPQLFVAASRNLQPASVYLYVAPRIGLPNEPHPSPLHRNLHTLVEGAGDATK